MYQDFVVEALEFTWWPSAVSFAIAYDPIPTGGSVTTLDQMTQMPAYQYSTNQTYVAAYLRLNRSTLVGASIRRRWACNTSAYGAQDFAQGYVFLYSGDTAATNIRVSYKIRFFNPVATGVTADVELVETKVRDLPAPCPPTDPQPPN